MDTSTDGAALVLARLGAGAAMSSSSSSGAWFSVLECPFFVSTAFCSSLFASWNESTFPDEDLSALGGFFWKNLEMDCCFRLTVGDEEEDGWDEDGGIFSRWVAGVLPGNLIAVIKVYEN